jgi:transcriptional regulator with XRE-family HTH domain
MDIGNKIKNLRLQHSLTQEELADRCDLTKGYISQLENNLTSPSIETLRDILAALGTNFQQFFSEAAERKIVHTAKDYITKKTSGIRFTWLVADSQKNMMEPTLVTIDAGKKTMQDLPHEGEEFGFVLEGEITIILGKREYRCKKGQSFYYKCEEIHYITNKSGKSAKILWISTPPNF